MILDGGDVVGILCGQPVAVGSTTGLSVREVTERHARHHVDTYYYVSNCYFSTEGRQPDSSAGYATVTRSNGTSIDPSAVTSNSTSADMSMDTSNLTSTLCQLVYVSRYVSSYVSKYVRSVVNGGVSVDTSDATSTGMSVQMSDTSPAGMSVVTQSTATLVGT